MKLSAVKMLIEEGEGFELEFKGKVSSPKKIARTICAFANTRGGTILFGVDDDGSLVGVESEKTEIDLIESAGSYYCEPPIEVAFDFVPYRGKEIIVAYVNESDNKPHTVIDSAEPATVYIRVNDNTVLASKEVIKVLRDERPEAQPLRIIIGENEKRLFQYLETNTRITVQRFADIINISKRRASRILTTLVRSGVIRIHTLEKEDYFTFAHDDEVFGENHTKQSHKRQRH